MCVIFIAVIKKQLKSEFAQLWQLFVNNYRPENAFHIYQNRQIPTLEACNFQHKQVGKAFYS